MKVKKEFKRIKIPHRDLLTGKVMGKEVVDIMKEQVKMVIVTGNIFR